MEEEKVSYNPTKDYYHLLGVAPGASIVDIKKAHKKVAKKYHPDLNPDNREWATRQFQQINEAYETLGKPAARVQYDRERWKTLAKEKITSSIRRETETPKPPRTRTAAKSPDRLIGYAFLAMFGLMILALFALIAIDAVMKGFSGR